MEQNRDTQALTASSPKWKIQVVRLDNTTFCENGLCVILGYEAEDLPATFHVQVPPIANWVTSKLQEVAGRCVTSNSGQIYR